MLFGVLWSNLAEVMGAAATATLVRRAVKHAASRAPALADVAITRERFEYRYTLPDSWRDGTDNACASLRLLASELEPLLVDLTGVVVVGRLRSVPELTRCGLFSAEVAP